MVQKRASSKGKQQQQAQVDAGTKTTLLHASGNCGQSQDIAADVLGCTLASAVVRDGDTLVVCGARAVVGRPSAEAPHRGFIVPNFAFANTCLPDTLTAPVQERLSMRISRLMQQIVDREVMFDLSALCIVPESACWVLYCDVICVDYGGTVEAAALNAFFEVLRTLRLPRTSTPSAEGRIVAEAPLVSAERERNTDGYIPLRCKCELRARRVVFCDGDVIETPRLEQEAASTGKLLLVTAHSDDNKTVTPITVDFQGPDSARLYSFLAQIEKGYTTP